MPKGGARAGAGRKPKPLSQKIAEGNLGKRALKKLEFADNSPRKASQVETPDYLHKMAKVHHHFDTPTPAEIFRSTLEFLERTGCLHLVHEDLIANYAVARHYLLCAQCDLSKMTFVSRNKSNDMYITVPTEAMVLLQKNVTMTWQTIWDIISRNSEKVIPDPERELTAILVGGRARKPKSKTKGDISDAELDYNAENPDSATDPC
jgi:hypothetical protein